MCSWNCNFFKYIVNAIAPKEVVSINNVQFTLQKELAKGGYAVVYLVHDVFTGEPYAIKRIKILSKREKERVMKEIEILSKFNKHPHISKMFDYEVILSPDNTEEVFILLEYYPQGNLWDYIQKFENPTRYLSEDEILHIFIGICAGVSVLHSQKPPLAHRDLKPQNIILAQNLKPVLLDFGSTDVASIDLQSVVQNTEDWRKQKSSIQEDCLEISTPSYRPPELFNLGGIFEDIAIDQRMDVWSLGCLLYFMAFHINPFDAQVLRGGSLKLAIQGGAEAVKFPQNSPYSKELHNFITSMLQVDASKRPFLDAIIHKAEMLQRAAERSQHEILQV